MSSWLDRKLRPMLASSGQPFDSPDHLFEIKWDGIRALIFFGRGRLRLQSRRLTDLTPRYPELVQAVQMLPGEAVLDGEIVILEEGKPSIEKVLQREQSTRSGKVALRSRQVPATYMVFDLLFLNGRELIDSPLSQRRALLSGLLRQRSSPRILESTYVLDKGIAYYQEAVSRGLEGIMAKSLDSRYVPGLRTRAWVKIKARRSLDCVVLAAVLEPGTTRVKSLVLGAHREGALVWMGNVGSGLDSTTLVGLARELGHLEGTPPEGLGVSASGEVRWLKPLLVARVRYQELTTNGRLRFPVFVGFVNSPPGLCRFPENLSPNGRPPPGQGRGSP